MARKLIGAQRPFTMLVANLRQGSDPSRGVSGNPQPMRQTYTRQRFVEIPGRGPEVVDQGRQPGTGSLIGVATSTVPGVPVGATGTITVGSAVFAGPTIVQLGAFVLTSGEEFAVGSAIQSTGSVSVVASPSIATLTIGGVALVDAVGARTPGSNDYDGTLGTPALIAADIVAAISDAANSFVALVTAIDGGGGLINLTAVPVGAAGDAVTLATTDALDITVSGANLTGGTDAGNATATNLAAAIDILPGYSAPVPGANVITVTGPPGPTGNVAVFVAGGSSPFNFVMDPPDGSLSGAEPSIGPPVLT